MASMSAPLRKILQARSAKDLARLGETWAVFDLKADGKPGQEIQDQGMLEIVHARFAWETLTPDAREILHQMIVHQVMDGVPREDLQKLASLSSVAFVNGLSQLEQNLMLIETRPNARVRSRLGTRGQQVDHVLAIPKDFHDIFSAINREIYEIDRTTMSLAEVLATLSPDKFQTLSTLSSMSMMGSTFSFYTGGHTPSSLGLDLMKAATIADSWERLEETDRQVCRWLCQADGIAQIADIQAALNLPRTAMSLCVYRLENFGLAFPTFSGQEHRLFMDRGIFKLTRKLINEQEESQKRAKQFSLAIATGEKPPIVHEGHSQLLSDLAIVVNAVHQMVIEPTQAGNVPKRLANKIFPLLHGSRPVYYEDADYYLEMIFSIAKSLNLVRLQHNKSQKDRYMPGAKLKEWARMETFEQTRSLLALWQKGSDRAWSDIAGVNYQSDMYGFGYYIDASSSRQGLLEYVAEQCQPGKWYALPSLLHTIKEQHPLLLRERSRYASYSGQRNRKEVQSHWDTADGEIIAGMLSSSLHEMGLVTLGYQSEATTEDGYEEAKNPDAIEFTELAGQVIWETPTTRSEDSEHARTLIVQPNFELLLLQPDYPTLYKLLPFVRVEQIDMVSRLTLTQESIRRGVESGYSVEEIIGTLRTYSQKELPQNVLYTLQDWSRLYKNATISQIIVIEVGSESVADEIYASTKLRSLELRRLGPCAIAVGGQVSLQVLRTALEKEGIILHIQGDILNARDGATTSTSYGKRK